MDWLKLCNVRWCWLMSASQVSNSLFLFSLCFLLPSCQEIIKLNFIYIYYIIYVYFNWLMVFLEPMWNTCLFFLHFLFMFLPLNIIAGWLILGNVCYHTPFGKLQIIPPHSFSMSNIIPENLWNTLVIVLPFPYKVVC